MVLILIPVDMELLVLQRAYIASHSNSICKSKRFLTSNFVTWTVRKVLQEHWSLDACHGYALDNHLFPLKEIVCVKTLYNYVDSMLLDCATLTFH